MSPANQVSPEIAGAIDEARQIAGPGVHGREAILSGSLDQMFVALQSFNEEARHGQATLLLCFGAGGAILVGKSFLGESVAGSMDLFASAVVAALAAGAFLIPAMVRPLYQEKMRATYEIYVAAACHAALLWKAAGCINTHEWLKFVDTIAQTARGDYREDGRSGRLAYTPRSDAPLPTSTAELIAVWAAGPTTRYRFYERSYQTAARLGAACAVLVGGYWVYQWARTIFAALVGRNPSYEEIALLAQVLWIGAVAIAMMFLSTWISNRLARFSTPKP